ncbi:MAG: DUF4307 domain-containing protein [Actinomycetota bacterium]|nr:DUF4307 domain-containing protein [Actinomycetota bacterium]
MHTTPESRRRRRWWVVGVLGVAAMALVAVWFGIAATAGRVHWVNTGFEVAADDEVQVRFDVIRDPGREVVCELQALDDRYTRVGTAQVRVEPAESSPSRHTATVRTVSRATTGYVDACAYAAP